MTGDMGGHIVRVPDPSASVGKILEFAATYNAYECLVAEPEPMERMLWPIYDDIERSSQVPDWVRLDLARALLFYAYRRDYLGGGYGPYEPMRALVERIRTQRWAD